MGKTPPRYPGRRTLEPFMVSRAHPEPSVKEQTTPTAGWTDQGGLLRTKRRSTIDSMTRGTILLTTDASSVGRAILTELERRPTRSGGRRLAGATTGPTLAVGDQQVPGIEGQLLAIVHVASVCAAPSTAELTMPELHAAFSFGERFGAPIYLVSSGFPCDEQAVAAVRASGLPHVLVRTSLVIGSTRSRTGPNPRALTQLIDAAVSGLLPFTHMDTQLLDLCLLYT